MRPERSQRPGKAGHGAAGSGSGFAGLAARAGRGGRFQDEGGDDEFPDVLGELLVVVAQDGGVGEEPELLVGDPPDDGPVVEARPQDSGGFVLLEETGPGPSPIGSGQGSGRSVRRGRERRRSGRAPRRGAAAGGRRGVRRASPAWAWVGGGHRGRAG